MTPYHETSAGVLYCGNAITAEQLRALAALVRFSGGLLAESAPFYPADTLRLTTLMVRRNKAVLRGLVSLRLAEAERMPESNYIGAHQNLYYPTAAGREAVRNYTDALEVPE